MADTHFVNPHGMTNDEHYTTAADLFSLARACMANPTFAQVVATPSYTTAPTNKARSGHHMETTNRLLSTKESNAFVPLRGRGGHQDGLHLRRAGLSCGRGTARRPHAHRRSVGRRQLCKRRQIRQTVDGRRLVFRLRLFPGAGGPGSPVCPVGCAGFPARDAGGLRVESAIARYARILGRMRKPPTP